jgi:hypothetical protein
MNICDPGELKVLRLVMGGRWEETLIDNMKRKVLCDRKGWQLN